MSLPLTSLTSSPTYFPLVLPVLATHSRLKGSLSFFCVLELSSFYVLTSFSSFIRSHLLNEIFSGHSVYFQILTFHYPLTFLYFLFLSIYQWLSYHVVYLMLSVVSLFECKVHKYHTLVSLHCLKQCLTNSMLSDNLLNE